MKIMLFQTRARTYPDKPQLYCTVNVITEVCVTLPVPEAALTVTLYVPAGVPVVSVVLPLEPHPACSKIKTKKPTPKAVIIRRRRREIPPNVMPRNVKPKRGSDKA